MLIPTGFFVRRAPLLALGALLFALGAAGCGEPAVATVNGRPITEREFLERCASTIPSPQGEETTIGAQVLRHLIFLSLVEEEAREMGALPTDTEIEQVYEFGRFEREVETGRSYEELLADEGRTAEHVRRDVYEMLLLRKFRFHDVPVEEEAVREYYDENPDEFVMPPRVRLSIIRMQEREQIERVQQELDANAQFATLARSPENMDPSRENNGQLPGYLTPGAPFLEPQLMEAAFSLEEREHSDPIEVGTHWAIIRVDEKKAAIELEFERVRPLLFYRLQEERGQDRMMDADRKILEMIQQAEIEVHRPEYEEFVRRMRGFAGGPGMPGAPGHEGHGH